MIKGKKSKRVLMVIPSFYPSVGGAEQQLYGLTEALGRIGQRTTVVTRRLDNCAAHEVLAGAEVYRLPWKPYPMAFLTSLSVFLIKNRKEFDLIHVHTLNSPFLVCAFLGRILGVPVVAKVTRTGRGSQIHRYQTNYYRKKLFFSAAKLITKFIAITDDAGQELQQINVPGSKISRIPNGVLIPNTKKQHTDATTRLCFVGRLIPRKRVDWLIQAIADLRDQGRLGNCKVSIIGDGSSRMSLERFVEETNLSDTVAFLGQMDSSDVIDNLSQHDCLVLPSESEGLSNALLEAMASGLTVIAADIPANQGIVESGVNGLLFCGMPELADCIETVCADPSLASELAVKGKATVVASYSMDKIATMYTNLYQSIGGAAS